MGDLKRIDEWNDELLTAAAKGLTQIYQQGQQQPYKLTSAQWETFEQAKSSGYLVARSNKKEQALFNVWCKWCEIRRIPYIKVVPRNKFAFVSMDLIALPYELNEAGQNKLMERMELAGCKRDSVIVASVYSFADKATLESAHQIAWSMIEISLNYLTLTEHHRREQLFRTE